MINETPTWNFHAKRSLTRWYGHVQWLPDGVIGQWFYLDRRTGSVRWERNQKPDEIVGIADGVIVANERRRQHLSSLRYGCFGICLETGKVSWTSHSSGMVEGLRRVLGWSDCPILVADNRVFCRSGRVLDVATGRLLERVPKERIEVPNFPELETVLLGRSKSLSDPVRLKVSEGRWLSHKLEANADAHPTDEEFFESVWDFRLFLTADDGSVLWKFDLDEAGYESRYCPYLEKCRYAFPFLYVLACEKRTTRMENSTEVYNPSPFHLLTLDVNTGQILQDVRVFDDPMEKCRFEDIDERGVLISDSGTKLLCFDRTLAFEQRAILGKQI